MVHHKNKPKVLDNKKMKNMHNTLCQKLLFTYNKNEKFREVEME